MTERDGTSAALTDSRRLAALRATRLLDSPPEPDFDRWTGFVCSVLDSDVSLITLLDRDRQFFKSATGLGEPWASRRETPLSHSFCKFVVTRNHALVVSDAREDPELADNPAIPELGVVAYAGVPLRTRDGILLGSVSAIQHGPREWTGPELEILRDVAAAARSEIELRASEERFRAITANVFDLVAVLDEQGRITYHSDSLMRLLGSDREPSVGRSFLELVHPGDRDDVREAIEEAVAEGGAGESAVTFRMVDQDGSVRVLEALLTDLVENPAVGGVLSVARDVTAHRELEARLRQSQKMDAIGRLAGGVAHDFNNILSVIQSSAEMALDDMPSSLEARRDVEEIADAARRGQGLTGQLLAFSRRQELRPRDVDLNEVMARSARLLHRLVGEKVTLEVSSAGEPCVVRADPVQLEQVIMNLVINARDAMPEGGRVTLTCRPGEGPEHRAGPEDAGGRRIVLEVADTGHGMEEEIRAHAFEPFFTTKEEGRGTGLGLATVYGIVKQSGGDVEIESAPGEGTRVVVSLPGRPRG